MEDKEQKVLEAMRKAGEPVRPGDVAEMVSLPKDEVSKIIKGLKKNGKVTSPKRCFWTTTEQSVRVCWKTDVSMLIYACKSLFDPREVFRLL